MFTKEQLKKKIKGIDGDIQSRQAEIVSLERERTGVIQDMINTNPEIVMINQQINTAIAEMNRLTGKKDTYEDFLEMLKPPKGKKKSK